MFSKLIVITKLYNLSTFRATCLLNLANITTINERISDAAVVRYKQSSYIRSTECIYIKLRIHMLARRTTGRLEQNYQVA